MKTGFHTATLFTPLQTRGRVSRVKLQANERTDHLQLVIYMGNDRSSTHDRSIEELVCLSVAVYLLCCSEEAAPAQPAAAGREGDSSLYVAASLAKVVIYPRSAASHSPARTRKNRP